MNKIWSLNRKAIWHEAASSNGSWLLFSTTSRLFHNLLYFPYSLLIFLCSFPEPIYHYKYDSLQWGWTGQRILHIKATWILTDEQWENRRFFHTQANFTSSTQSVLQGSHHSLSLFCKSRSSPAKLFSKRTPVK